MKTAIHCGISISEYEEMTPYELNLIAESYEEMQEVEAHEKVTLVWLNEYYHRQKKLPSLKKCLEEFFGKEKQPMSDEEMLKVVERLNSQFNGNIEMKSGD